jgi:hypothetical protein
MNDLQRDALLAAFLDKLHQTGVWCTEFRTQKSTYLLQELLDVPLQFPFIFYKHGPFCFELTDAVVAMKAHELLTIAVRPSPYGPALVVTPLGREFYARYPATLGKYDDQLTRAVQEIGPLKPPDLERISGALFLSQNRNCDVNERARRLHERTPHVPLHEARMAVAQLDQLMQETGTVLKE